MMSEWLDELEALKAEDEERMLPSYKYRRWEELERLIAEGFEEEAKKYGGDQDDGS